eukprot:1539796-Pleurochrysis_carterae.AAC.1
MLRCFLHDLSLLGPLVAVVIFGVIPSNVLRSTHHAKGDSSPRRRADQSPTARHARPQRDWREG